MTGPVWPKVGRYSYHLEPEDDAPVLIPTELWLTWLQQPPMPPLWQDEGDQA